MSEFRIEQESAPQLEAIRELLRTSFSTNGEAELVDELREAGALPVSLIWTENEVVLGHVAFSPVSVDAETGSRRIWGLAPLAVAARVQGRGIGSALVRAGLEACRDACCDAVVVLGDPRFYSRFGFRPAAERGLRCVFDAPPEAFMRVELQNGSVSGRDGIVRFHPAFDRFG